MSGVAMSKNTAFVVHEWNTICSYTYTDKKKKIFLI